jgi:tetratricopeptide (TPR) repeat protein
VLAALGLAAWAARAGARLGLAGRLLVISALPAAVLPGLRTEIYGLAAQRQDIIGTDPALEAQREDPEAVVSVVTGYEPPEARRVTRIFVGRKMQADDITPWLRVEKRMGALPALLCPAAGGRSLHVGLGSGVTASWSAAAAPGRAVECAELVPAIAAEAGRFRPHNSVGSFAVWIGDGRTRLLQERGKFELIVTDIVFPEDAGAGGLFSVEYFRLAESRLADGGAFAQWLPLFQMPPESFKAAVRGFRNAFPDATLWAGCLDARKPVAMLLGIKGGAPGLLDRDALSVRIKAAKLPPARLAELGLDSPEAVASHLIAGPKKLAGLDRGGPACTDDLPLVEFRARAAESERGLWAVRNMELILNELWDWEVAAGWGEDARRLRLARRRLAEGGLRLLSSGGVLTGLAKLREARELNPADPETAYALWDALTTLASQALAAGEAEQARQWLEESLKHGPARNYILHDLAKALTALDRTKEALARAREATQLDSGDPNNWDLLAKMAHNARETEESERAGRKAAELRRLLGLPDPPPAPLRGRDGS